MRLAFLLAMTACAVIAAPADVPRMPEVKFSEHRLDNGLQLLVVEDHDAPTFSICVAYKVGSRDERKGRTGFAHLFEHMMFKGSERIGPGEHFYLVFTNGGNMNGTTNQDRTNYFETLPKNQLDLAMFLESDRMRSLAITKENLDNQRNAVQEERRLGIDNRPYGQVYEKMLELAYDNFAYKHSTIGSMEDLNAATVEDVSEFFKTYYAPNNAVLAIVGDVSTAEVVAKAKKYFGDIRRQEPPKPVDLSEPPPSGERRAEIRDKLARLTQLSIAYKIPPGGHPDTDAMSVLGMILGAGESSRLYQRLVKEKELVTQISSYAGERGGPGLFQITAMIRPGKDPKEVETAIYEEIAKARDELVTPKELLRARSMMRRQNISLHESTMMRAFLIADAAAIYGDPNRINTALVKRLAITENDVQQAAKKYLEPANRMVITTVPAGGPPRPASAAGTGE